MHNDTNAPSVGSDQWLRGASSTEWAESRHRVVGVIRGFRETLTARDATIAGLEADVKRLEALELHLMPIIKDNVRFKRQIETLLRVLEIVVREDYRERETT